LKKNNRNLHYVHYYPGRIYPYIPLYLLSLADFADLDGFVLDPSAGSGTIMLESIINPVFKRNALGVEINPLARLISKVKTTIIDFTEIENSMKELFKLYLEKEATGEHIPVFNWKGSIHRLLLFVKLGSLHRTPFKFSRYLV